MGLAPILWSAAGAVPRLIGSVALRFVFRHVTFLGRATEAVTLTVSLNV